MKNIQEDIKTGKFRQAYLLYGEEAYLKQQYKRNLVKALNPDDDTMNFTRYEGKGIDVRELISLCDTMPFFAERRVILLEDTGFFKNKCEELLNAEECPDPGTAICVFDMNDLHTINNTLGHDKGDEYIRSFARLLRQTIPSQHFVGRDGGDEFLAILYDVNRESALAVMRAIQKQAAERSKQQPEMPLSYAAGCALAADFEGCTMRELFRHADQNMYLDKTRVKQEEGKDIRNMRGEN